MGRPNIYGNSGMNQYGMPNINPSYPFNSAANQPVKHNFPLSNSVLPNNFIKPPSSDNNTNGILFFTKLLKIIDHAFLPPEPESEDNGKINNNEPKKDDKIDDIRIE